MTIKALALLSGGLDSTLAIRVLQEQGIEVVAINFMSIFCTCTPRGNTCSASVSAARQLGVELKVFEISEEFLKAVKAPVHGYGRNFNPCLDCRILKFKKARDYMEEIGASFLITGEVLGQRPMSQRREAMALIDRESGTEGLVLRPLCAKFMDETIPEKEGLVDRSKLLDIEGRSRKPQIELAREYDIHDYPCPAGGCRLTDEGFGRRIKDLMDHDPQFGLAEAKLLKTGRHFRLSPKAKLVAGRDEQDNELLMRLVRSDDIQFAPKDFKGPVGIGRGDFDNGAIEQTARIIARYSRLQDDGTALITVQAGKEGEVQELKVVPELDEELSRIRL